MKINRIIALGLTTLVLLSVFIGCTDESSDTSEEKDKEATEDQESTKNNEDNPVTDSIGDSNYKNYVGKVSNVSTGEEKQVTVDGEGESDFKSITFNILDDTVVINDKTEEIIGVQDIQKGNSIEVIYDKYSPMTRSIPPITNAKTIVIRKSDINDRLGIKVSEFDEDLISKDNSLELIVDDNTSIVNLDGENLRKKDIIEKEVLVFFGPTQTLSIPAQSSAKKIILLLNSSHNQDI